MITSPLGPRLAQQGLKAMFAPQVQYGKEQARIGETYLASIQSDSLERNEMTVAGTAREAWNSVEQWRGQVAVAEASLRAIAGGIVGGPIGAVLADVGEAAMYNDTVQTIRDQAFIGLTFVEAIRDHSEDSQQRVLADTALRSAQNASHARTQVGILGNFLISQ